MAILQPVQRSSQLRILCLRWPSVRMLQFSWMLLVMPLPVAAPGVGRGRAELRAAAAPARGHRAGRRRPHAPPAGAPELGRRRRRAPVGARRPRGRGGGRRGGDPRVRLAVAQRQGGCGARARAAPAAGARAAPRAPAAPHLVHVGARPQRRDAAERARVRAGDRGAGPPAERDGGGRVPPGGAGRVPAGALPAREGWCQPPAQVPPPRRLAECQRSERHRRGCGSCS